MRTRHLSSSGPVPPYQERHRPVLLHEVVAALNVRPDDAIVDATLGGAGHAKGLAEGLGRNGLFVGFDLDSDAVRRARKALSHLPCRRVFVEANFRNMGRELGRRGIANVTKILFDLGWSSHQLDSGLPADVSACARSHADRSAQAGRGFSFLADEPLLMTYEKRPAEGALTAREIVNRWGERSLADVFYGFGGERHSRRIAKAIVERRKRKPFTTSRELAETISRAVPARYRRGRIHPATRVFQALRIAVNDELGALDEGLRAAWVLLAPRGRLAAISFHSVEDRIVKRAFSDLVKRGEGRLVFRKPVRPSAEEVRSNPSSRSAKLRVIEKISHESQNKKNKQIHPIHIPRET